MAANFRFSKRSEGNLQGVDPRLVKVIRRGLILSEVDFVVTCGLRTEAEQRRLVAKGASRTMKSNHLTGRAVDVVAWVDGKATYEMRHMRKIAEAVKAAAAELKVSVVWGGDWKSFVDTPHFELERNT